MDRLGGTYGFDETVRWADGRTERRSWTERLTAAEATERMGPLPDPTPTAEGLTDWLAEQHAADERVALEATTRHARWVSCEEMVYDAADDQRWDDPGRCSEHPPGKPNPCDDNPIIDADAMFENDDQGAERATHIARHDPQSVLARIEAERAIVALHRDDDGHCSVCAGWSVDLDPLPYPCPTLRALAWGYRHRDGWQAQWAPEGVEVGA